MIVYLAGAIQAFVMYCVNGTSRSSLLIESTDSMISMEFMANVSSMEGEEKLSKALPDSPHLWKESKRLVILRPNGQRECS